MAQSHSPQAEAVASLKTDPDLKPFADPSFSARDATLEQQVAFQRFYGGQHIREYEPKAARAFLIEAQRTLDLEASQREFALDYWLHSREWMRWSLPARRHYLIVWAKADRKRSRQVQLGSREAEFIHGYKADTAGSKIKDAREVLVRADAVEADVPPRGKLDGCTKYEIVTDAVLRHMVPPSYGPPATSSTKVIVSSGTGVIVSSGPQIASDLEMVVRGSLLSLDQNRRPCFTDENWQKIGDFLADRHEQNTVARQQRLQRERDTEGPDTEISARDIDIIETAQGIEVVIVPSGTIEIENGSNPFLVLPPILGEAAPEPGDFLDPFASTGPVLAPIQARPKIRPVFNDDEWGIIIDLINDHTITDAEALVQSSRLLDALQERRAAERQAAIAAVAPPDPVRHMIGEETPDGRPAVASADRN